MIASLSILLDYEKIEDEDDSDASSDEDETSYAPQIVLSKQSVYKVLHYPTITCDLQCDKVFLKYWLCCM